MTETFEKCKLLHVFELLQIRLPAFAVKSWPARHLPKLYKRTVGSKRHVSFWGESFVPWWEVELTIMSQTV